MIELNQKQKLSKDEITSQVANVKELKQIGRVNFHPKRTKLFVYDANSKQVREASYKQEVFNIATNKPYKQYIGKSGEAYCFAINLKNAIKKFRKEGYEFL